jgi:hypothetical protein
MKTKVGEEPKLLFVLDEEGEPTSIFVIGDTLDLCKLPDNNIDSAVLVLIAWYFLLNLNYPEYYAQILGLIQHYCINVEVPEAQRKAGFMQLLSLM